MGILVLTTNDLPFPLTLSLFSTGSLMAVTGTSRIESVRSQCFIHPPYVKITEQLPLCLSAYIHSEWLMDAHVLKLVSKLSLDTRCAHRPAQSKYEETQMRLDEPARPIHFGIRNPLLHRRLRGVAALEHGGYDEEGRGRPWWL